jgi:hypothetical protein
VRTWRACGCTLECHVEDAALAALLDAIFGSLGSASAGNPPLDRLHITASNGHFNLRSEHAGSSTHTTLDGLVYAIDKHFTIALQRARRDLLFVHAAVARRGGAAIVLAAEPNTGKSTLALALLEAGEVVLSDELAPIDVRHRTVEAYPRALCLKTPPPPPLALPGGVIRAGTRTFLPLSLADRNTVPGVRALAFLTRRAQRETAMPLSAAAAAAHLRAHMLNPSAHGDEGLEAAVALAAAVPAWMLSIADLNLAVAAAGSLFGLSASAP